MSLVMPVYNAADTVAQAIGSLLRQTYGDFEIIVVDDGSTDESPAIIGDTKDPRLRLFSNNHRGLVGALCFGCAQARGKYIARLDADDTAREQRFAAQVMHLEGHQETGLLGTWATIETDNGTIQVFDPPTTDSALRRYLLWDNPFIHSSVMLRSSAYKEAGGYTEGPNEDYRLWVRIARLCELAVLPETLVTHRVRGDSVSRDMPRRRALQTRLACQWEAATTLGPWRAALPALAITAGAYILALAGGGLDPAIRKFVRRKAGAPRRTRHIRPQDRSGSEAAHHDP